MTPFGCRNKNFNVCNDREICGNDMEKLIWQEGRTCGDNVTFEREGLCNLMGEKMDSYLK